MQNLGMKCLNCGTRFVTAAIRPEGSMAICPACHCDLTEVMMPLVTDQHEALTKEIAALRKYAEDMASEGEECLDACDVRYQPEASGLRCSIESYREWKEGKK